jgi:parallel beta-helix repeat protein
MKKILLFLLLFSSVVYAGYSTPGTGKSWNLDSLTAFSGGSVTFSGGVYYFNDTLNITQSDTLKILINTTVKLAPIGVFNVYGTLIINPPDSVKFTSADTTQKFYEMRLEDLSDASVMKKMIFEYSYNGIRLLNTSPLIDSCTIRYNCTGNTSTTAPAINLFNSNAVISHCKIYRNYKVAIGGGANIANAPQILYNAIYENNIANANASQINLGASGTGTTLIKGNIIRGLYIYAGGIATLPTGTLNIVIEDNIIKNNRYGIALQNANTNAIIRGNIIDSNNIQGVPMLGGSGINFLGNSTLTAVVTRNFIRWNLWGITIQNTAKPNLGNLSNADTSDDGYNYIYGNSNSDTIYDLYNNTPDSIKAENNFWGTGNLSIIEQHIFHKPDNPALGFVDYIPIYIPVSVSNNGSMLPSGYKLFNIYPNPFNPAAVITYELPKAVHVYLKVYDILGNEISVLENGLKQAGKHEVLFNGGNLSSGVYFVVLKTDGFVDSKKFVLIK